MEAEPQPGYRVTVEELLDENAMRAIMHASTMMQEKALESRRRLLAVGFSVDHKFCKELDKTTQQYADAFQVARRQLVQLTKEQEVSL